MGSFGGPVVFGLILDLADPTGSGGANVIAWGWAFVGVGLVVAMGPLFLFVLAREDRRFPDELRRRNGRSTHKTSTCDSAKMAQPSQAWLSWSWPTAIDTGGSRHGSPDPPLTHLPCAGETSRIKSAQKTCSGGAALRHGSGGLLHLILGRR